jgi:hypothetical protein
VEVIVSSTAVAPGVRPLKGPAVGAVIALGVTAAQLLLRLPTSWKAYQELVSCAESGRRPPGIPVILCRAVEPDFQYVTGTALSFTCAMAFLTAWAVRARRNAAVAAPHHPFRYSPARAVACLLAPLGFLWLAGPVIAEIADASRPPAARSRPVLDRLWWFGILLAALGFTAAVIVGRWTPVGSASDGDGPTIELPTPVELSAQLAVAVLQTVATVAFVVGVAFLTATVIRTSRWQASTPPAAPCRVVDGPSDVERPALVRAAAGCAALAVAVMALIVVLNVGEVTSRRWNLTGLERQVFFHSLVPLLAVNIGEIVALCVATVRFSRRRRSGVSLVVTACAVFWLRWLFSAVGPQPGWLGLGVWVMNWVALLACLATVVLVERASRPVRQ